MTEKPRKTQKKANSVTPAGGEKIGGIVVHGGMHAGRDMIVGNQYNYQDQRIANINTSAQFLEALAQVQEQVAEFKKNPELTSQQVQMVEIVEGQVQQAAEETKKPQPVGARITATLTSAKATMDKISEAVKSAVGLGLTLGGLAQIALKLFGG